MSYFDDLLKSPLPSASGSDSLLMESEDGDFEKELDSAMKEFDSNEGCGDNEFDDACGSQQEGCREEGCGEEGCDTEEDGIDDIMSNILNSDDEPEDDDDDEDDEDDDDDIDADLEDLEREVNVNGSLQDVDPDNHIPVSVDDPTPAKPVEGQADEDADRMLAICATPTVLDDTLTVEEAVEFIESGDADIAVSEGLMLESDLTAMLADLSDDNGEFTEAVKFANPNQKFKMTKKARLRQLYELSLQIEARAHRDPYYPKIQKAYKIERTIKEGWRKRYGSLAMRRAKRYLKALMTSKSPTMQKAAKRLTK